MVTTASNSILLPTDCIHIVLPFDRVYIHSRSQGVSQIYNVAQGVSQFNIVSQGISQIYNVAQGVSQFNIVSQGVSQIYNVAQGDSQIWETHLGHLLPLEWIHNGPICLRVQIHQI
jgi:hypothetical protein